MRSHARLLGHPLHAMLVAFPLGLLASSAVFDVLFLATGRQAMATVAFWAIAAGLIGGTLAAIPGVIDWLAIPESTRAKRIGTLHAIANMGVLGLFALSWIARDADQPPTLFPMLFSFLAVLLALVAAWMGGELVTRLGVGVDDDRHLNASSSLRRQP